VRDEGFIGRSEADSGNARVLGWLKAYMNSEVTKEKVLSNANAQNGVRNSYRFRTRSLPGSSSAPAHGSGYAGVADSGSSREYWITFSRLISEPSAHAPAPSGSLSDSQAGRSA
jgi:hypothetical protein